MNTIEPCKTCQERCSPNYTAICTCPAPFSPELYEAKLHINKDYILNMRLPVIIDIETDEKDNPVGLAITQDGNDIFYYTSSNWNDFLAISHLETSDLVGHNLKGDIKW